MRKGNHCLIKHPFHKGHFNRICRHSRASISVWLRLGSDVKQQEQNEETSHCSGSFHIKGNTATMSHSTNLGMPKIPTETNVSEVVQSWPTIWQTDIVSHGRQVRSPFTLVLNADSLSLVRFYLSGHNQSLPGLKKNRQMQPEMNNSKLDKLASAIININDAKMQKQCVKN